MTLLQLRQQQTADTTHACVVSTAGIGSVTLQYTHGVCWLPVIGIFTVGVFTLFLHRHFLWIPAGQACKKQPAMISTGCCQYALAWKHAAIRHWQGLLAGLLTQCDSVWPRAQPVARFHQIYAQSVNGLATGDLTDDCLQFEVCLAPQPKQTI